MTGCQTEDFIELDEEMLIEDQEIDQEELSDMETDAQEEIEEEVKKVIEHNEELPFEDEPNTSAVEADYIKHGDDTPNDDNEGNVNPR